MFASRTQLRTSDVVIRAAIVGLALATGYIHSTLGGLLFTLNAIGYLVAAVAMIIPLALAVRFRWVVRLGLIGYAFTTIIGWAIQGPYYQTAYIAKAIEVALIVLVAVDFARMDGNPIAVVKRELASFASARHRPPRRGCRRLDRTAAAGSHPGRASPTKESDPMKRLVLGLGLVALAVLSAACSGGSGASASAPAASAAAASAPAGDAIIVRRQGPQVLDGVAHGARGRGVPDRLRQPGVRTPQRRHQGRGRGGQIQGRDRDLHDRSRTTFRPSPPAPTSSSAKSIRT